MDEAIRGDDLNPAHIEDLALTDYKSGEVVPVPAEEFFDEENLLVDLELRWYDPAELLLLDEADGEINAHFMRHETFAALVRNIERDGVPTSTPLACRHESGRPLVLSGNHRVKATRVARDNGKLKTPDQKIPVLFIDRVLSKERRVSIQLSHNSIVGEDDMALLKQLYEPLPMDEKLYAGLDDKQLALLDSISMSGIRAVPLDYQTIQFMFFPEEVARMRAVWEEVGSLIGRDTAYLARFTEYDRFISAIGDVRSTHNIINVASALLVVLDVFDRHKTDLAEGYCDPETGAALHRNHVPLSTVLGSESVPAETASRLNRIVQAMIQSGSVESDKRWQSLEAILEVYEASLKRD